MKKAFQASTLAAALVTASAAWATPSTTVWAPSTTYTQPFLVPHLTYDSYFARKADLSTTTGLTVGVLPFEALQAEVGFDLIMPGNDPLFLNGKVTLVEDKLFANQPALSIGVANGGVTTATNWAMAYGVLGKTIHGASIAAGAYYGLDEDLWREKPTGPDADGDGVGDLAGDKSQVGVLASIAAPPIKIGKPFLDSVVFLADVQTGSNVFGAWGAAAALYFTPSVSLLTGPVFFLEEDLQPNGQRFMWTMQLDVDLPGVADLLTNKKK